MDNAQAVPLGQVIFRTKNEITVQEDEFYRRLTIRLNGKGVEIRDRAQGSEIGTKDQFLVKRGQLILSKIDARNGAFGVVPDECDGAIITSNFWTYDVDRNRLDAQYFAYLTRTPLFIDFCVRASEGTTNRRYLQEPTFLAQRFPLPPLDEQRRIVARIEELAGKIEEARGLRREAVEETEALIENAIGATFDELDGLIRQPLTTLTSKIGSGSTPQGGRASYPASGIPFIRSMNVRIREFQWADIAYIDEQTHRVMLGTQVRPNDVLLNITGASIGRVACAPPELEEANVNQHVAIIRPLDCLASRYLMYWLSQPKIQEVISSEQKGATRQGFTKAQIGALSMPVPSLAEQHSIVAYLDKLHAKVDMLERLQAETSAELDALLPSVLDKAFKGEL